MRRLLALLLVCVLASAARAERTEAPAAPDREPPAIGRAPRDTASLVIVAPKTFRDEFLKLAHAHRKEGVAANVWTLESIVAAWPGRDDAERLRAFLADAYRRHGARDVLLAGDATLVPMRRVFVHDGSGDRSVATDQYYACLDGSWNADGDDVWGELASDSVDFVPELAVGRAPVANRADARRFVAKTIHALEAPPSPGGRVLLAAGTLQDLVDFAFLTEGLRPFFAPLPDVQVTRLYANSAGWPGALPLSRSALLDSMDAGFDLAVLAGAGGSGVFDAGRNDLTQLVRSEDMEQLHNGRPGFATFMSAFTCIPAPYPSIGASLINADGGASAVVGPSDLTYAGIGSAFAREVVKQVYVLGARTVGDAFTRAVAQLSLPSESFRLSVQAQVLLGDPLLPVRPAPVPAVAMTVLAAPTAPASRMEVPATLARAGSARAPRASDAVVAAAAPALSLARRAPGRFELAIPAALAGARYETAVFDPTGRRVRTLDRGVARAGTLSVAWDQTGDSGARVASGVYFVAVRVGGQFVTGRVAVVR